MITEPTPDIHAEKRKPLVLQMRGTLAWKAWIEELSKHCRMTVSSMADIAFAQFAKKQGFEKKPPDR